MIGTGTADGRTAQCTRPQARTTSPGCSTSCTAATYPLCRYNLPDRKGCHFGAAPPLRTRRPSH